MYPTHGYNITKHAGCEAQGSLIQPSNSLCRQKHLPGVQHRCALKRQHTVELLIVGSNANNGSQAGLGYVNSNNAWSNTNTNIGARLTLSEIQNLLSFCPNRQRSSLSLASEMAQKIYAERPVRASGAM